MKTKTESSENKAYQARVATQRRRYETEIAEGLGGHEQLLQEIRIDDKHARALIGGFEDGKLTVLRSIIQVGTQVVHNGINLTEAERFALKLYL